MAYPTAAGTTSLSGTYIPEIWSSKLLVKFYEGTCLSEVSNTDYEGEIKQKGDKVHINQIPDITTREKEWTDNITIRGHHHTIIGVCDKGGILQTPKFGIIEDWNNQCFQKLTG